MGLVPSATGSTEEKMGLVPRVLDSQSLDAGFNAWTGSLSFLSFLLHLCQHSDSYDTISR